MITGINFAVGFYKRNKENELKNARLQTRLADAKLQALKMQIHPHFLFNSLNSLSTLIVKKENEKADRMLSVFSDFLRMSLVNSNEQEIPLKSELRFAKNYLEIEKIRFGDKLSVHFDISAETENLLVPGLILQPLIENSIKYAIAPRLDGGIIIIRANIKNDKLLLDVEDNGNGKNQNTGNASTGIGLKNTKERLRQLYGDDQKFEVKNLGNGFKVSVLFPVKISLENPGKVEEIHKIT